MTDCTVVIPVGPAMHHRDYLEEAIDSVRRQTWPCRVLLIDDMADLPVYELDEPWHSWATSSEFGLPVWRAPWRLGVPGAFNAGVALAQTECVFLMGSDDVLEPDCIRACLNCYEGIGPIRDAAYMWVGVRYMGGEYPDQYLPCNAAMVTKSLWRRCGGFAPESAVGACDAALISTLMVHPEAGRLVCVDGARPLYNYRVTSTSDTAEHGGSWQGPIIEVRNLLTRDWRRPDWGRFL